MRLTSAPQPQVHVTWQQPLITTIDAVLQADECTQLINFATAKFEPAIAHRAHRGVSFKRGENDFISDLDARLARLLQVPVAWTSGLQVHCQRDAIASHVDFFDLTNPTNAFLITHGGQRVATLMVHLNDVDDGGVTCFDDLQLFIAARAGQGLYFRYRSESGALDATSRHSCSAVMTGVRWTAIKYAFERAIDTGPWVG